jgi:hypothetical protein
VFHDPVHPGGGVKEEFAAKAGAALKPVKAAAARAITAKRRRTLLENIVSPALQ